MPDANGWLRAGAWDYRLPYGYGSSAVTGNPIPIARRARPAAATSPRHYSERTARTYIRWVVRYVRFHGTRHPSELSQEDVVEFLSALAIRDRVSASTQNQAMAAISFLYREVLSTPLEELSPIARAKRAVRLPVVLTKEEVKSTPGWRAARALLDVLAAELRR